VAVSSDDVSSLYLLELGIVSPKQLFQPAPPTTQGEAATIMSEKHVQLVPLPPPTTAAPLITMPSLSAHLSLLPPVSALDPLEVVLKLHPSGINFWHFRRRVINMFAHTTSDPQSRTAVHPGVPNVKDPTTATASDVTLTVVPLEEHTMSFYAAAASAFALAALVSDQAAEVDGDDDDGDDLDGNKTMIETEETTNEDRQLRHLASFPPILSPRRKMKNKIPEDPMQPLTKPSQLHRLAVRARAAYEEAVKAGGNGEMYDLDYLVSGFFCILWSLFGGGLKRGGTRGGGIGCLSISGAIYAEVGKMVNVARLMGLAFDPDESPGRWTLFQAEMRRRVWWDVVFYDSLVVIPISFHPSTLPSFSITRFTDIYGQIFI
jgi:hypothetical protein